MSKDSPSPPPAPDPTTTANAQSGANIATAIANARLNRVNQTTPWGSITYTQGPPDANGVPTWSSQIQLSPQQQQLLEQQQGMQLQRNQIAQGYLGKVGQTLDFSHLHPIDMRGQMYAGAVNAGPAPTVPAPTTAPNSAPPQTPPPSFNSDLINQLLAALTAGAGSGASGPSAPATPPPSGGTAPAGAAAHTHSMNVNAGAAGNPLDALVSQNHGSLWGDLGGLLYGQYNTVTNGGLDEQGNRVAPPDGMVTENDPRYQQAMRDLNGKTQLRNTNIGGPGGVIDPSKVTYDPKYGLVTDPSNLNPVGETFLDQYGPWLMAAIPAAAMAYGAIAGGGAAGGAAGGAGGALGADSAGGVIGTDGVTGAFDVGGSSGFGGSTALQAGVPVTDLSTTAAQPSIWQQMGSNLSNGRGLLGLSGGQRAAVGLLPTLLRALQSRNNTGGGK